MCSEVEVYNPTENNSDFLCEGFEYGPAIEGSITIQLIFVSDKPEYWNTLNHLIRETQSCLDRDISILWALAQRASVDAKVNACIECVLILSRNPLTYSSIQCGTERCVNEPA